MSWVGTIEAEKWGVLVAAKNRQKNLPFFQSIEAAGPMFLQQPHDNCHVAVGVGKGGVIWLGPPAERFE